jgi:feruloyl esterase
VGHHQLRRASLLAGVGSLVALTLPSIGAASPRSCEQLVNLKMPSTSVVSATPVAPGSFQPRDGAALPGLQAFCRVVGIARPTPDSQIAFEVWMPADWNGRLWANGNGDFAGSISEAALASRIAEGYASVGTDTGHRTAIQFETAWGLGHPQKVIDFAHRGIHEAAAAAKRLIGAYYGRPPSRSYFASCSNGGRQALMEAQRYPDDYDGIIAGAAAGDWTHLYVGAGLLYFQWLAAGPSYVPAAKVPAIHAAVLEQCDALDRIADGVIEDPRRCKLDLTKLLCRGPESDACLTRAQLATVEKLYAGPALASGRRLIPGYSPGAEDSWGEAHFGAGPATTDSYQDIFGFFRNLVFEDPNWNAGSFDAERDGPITERKLGAVIDAVSPDLTRFTAHGGKLIMYHGWSDPIVPAMMSVEYYRRVVERMGRRAAQSGIRLFMVPGMGHCGGGPGPNDFGQFAAGGGDPGSAVGAALQRWVEQGIAPERLIATKRTENSNAAIVRTRPLCAFPLVARYRGVGSTDAEASFDCAGTP